MSVEGPVLDLQVRSERPEASLADVCHPTKTIVADQQLNSCCSLSIVSRGMLEEASNSDMATPACQAPPATSVQVRWHRPLF